MKKKQRLIIIVATSIFDIIVLVCLMIQTNDYNLINQRVQAAAKNQVVDVESNKEVVTQPVTIENSNSIDGTVNEVLEIAEEEIIREEVYEAMTIEELSLKIERSLASDLTGKGGLIASYSLEKKVDPYLATAIMLHETGCANGNCSSLVKQCNNVGGQKGSGCNGYTYYATLDEGIMGFIDNLYNNYVAYGLLTAEDMNPKYAASTAWAGKVNSYIEKIRNN